jgi:REP element-mobilizing transposase RayT
MRRRFDIRVYGYVVMPEHVHLLMSEPARGTLADAIHYLKLSFSKRVKSVSQPGAPLIPLVGMSGMSHGLGFEVTDAGCPTHSIGWNEWDVTRFMARNHRRIGD